MSMHRLSAGSGFRYLLRHIACGDLQRSAAEPLTSYYAAHGYPAGRWMGAGLIGLGDDLGIRPGAAVTQEAVGALFGQGRDPLTDAPLGRPHPTFLPTADASTFRRRPGMTSSNGYVWFSDATKTASRSAPMGVRRRSRPG